MAIVISVEKSKPKVKAKVERLNFLPRFGLTVDWGGQKFIYRQAPILEALYNLRKEKFSFEKLMEISRLQVEEIELPKVKLAGLSKRIKSIKDKAKQPTKTRA